MTYPAITSMSASSPYQRPMRDRGKSIYTHTHTHPASTKPRISTDMTGHIYTEDPQIFTIWN